MNIETIVNQFETRAGTLLRYYTGLLEHSKVQPYWYFMYGLQTYSESNNSDVFEYLENGFDTDTLEGIQSSNTDVIANIEMLYQLATGINEPEPELVEGLKLVTEFIQDENATQEDYKALEHKLTELK
ncbi:hypothetical protein GJH00_13255, partial [Staphylococcus aureus]|nr:hypothetical protein [Staphylococcus aureus]